MDWVKSLKEYNAAKGKSGRKRKQVEEERVEDTEEDDTAGSSKQRTLKVKQLSNGTEKKHRPRMVKYIQDKRSRQKCFSRRKITLVKMAKSLHSLTGVAINLEITSESGKITTYKTHALQHGQAGSWKQPPKRKQNRPRLQHRQSLRNRKQKRHL